MNAPTSIETDWADIQASIQRDEVAFARLVQRYENAVAAQMWRFTRDRDVLSELVQDVFIEVFFSLKNYRRKSPLLHWIRKIATRVGYRYWKTRACERKQNQELKTFNLDSTQRVQDLNPSEAAEYLYELLESLPTKERLILTFHYFEGYDMKEIAGLTGWSLTTVKVRAYRARKKLKIKMERAGFGRSENE